MKANFSLLSVAAIAHAAVSTFAAAPWEDPAVNAINRLPARTFSVPCETEDLALDIMQNRRPKEASKWVLSLLMVIGRLEVFTIMVLFTRVFWRR